MKFLYIVAFLAGMITLAAAAAAQSATLCTFAISDINFGDVNLMDNAPIAATGTLTATCTGESADAIITICPSIETGSGGAGSSGKTRYATQGGNRLGYNLYRDPAHTDVWGSTDWAYPPKAESWLIPKTGSAVTATRTIYALIPAGQRMLSAGDYMSAFAGSMSAYIEYQEGNHSCELMRNSGHRSGKAEFRVRAHHKKACSVSTTPLNFGSVSQIASNIDATNSLAVTCTKGAAYQVSLSGGQSNAADPTKRKMSYNNASVTYGLYRNSARTLPWGDDICKNTLPGTGTGSPQSSTIYGRVPRQPTPAPGIYTDTVVVTVTY
jgi:spore coat protein U-like protein